MGEEILIRLEHAGFLIALFAVALIVVGFVVSTVRYLTGIRELTPEKNFTRHT